VTLVVPENVAGESYHEIHRGGMVSERKQTVDERAKRERAIRSARHTSELEGSRSTPATRADQDAYVRGEIDIKQLGARVRARYGLS
jgi:hypothetical protein